MTRILSQSGNVIAADFRQRIAPSDLTVNFTFKFDILYQDDAIMLTRAIASLDGSPVMEIHYAGNLKTGELTTL